MTDTYAENEKVVWEGLHIGDCGVWVISDPQPCDCGGDYPERALDAMGTEHRRALNRERTERGLALAAEAEAASLREQLRQAREALTKA